MDSEALSALAAAGGAAVVQAAGTDAWQELRRKVGQWLGRGQADREARQLRLLDATEAALAGAGQDDGERTAQAQAWSTRFAAVLESLDGDEREAFADRLRAALTELGYSRADGPGWVVNGDVRAGDGSVIAGTVFGGVNVGRPFRPDPPRG